MHIELKKKLSLNNTVAKAGILVSVSDIIYTANQTDGQMDERGTYSVWLLAPLLQYERTLGRNHQLVQSCKIPRKSDIRQG